ncbi:MAG: hypothetical protein LUF90_10250 [Rikenellaceae bacterium]|nr:hypothetical protein [Rikenellaceae bacterium]
MKKLCILLFAVVFAMSCGKEEVTNENVVAEETAAAVVEEKSQHIIEVGLSSTWVGAERTYFTVSLFKGLYAHVLDDIRLSMIYTDHNGVDHLVTWDNTLTYPNKILFPGMRFQPGEEFINGFVDNSQNIPDMDELKAGDVLHLNDLWVEIIDYYSLLPVSTFIYVPTGGSSASGVLSTTTADYYIQFFGGDYLVWE